MEEIVQLILLKAMVQRINNLPDFKQNKPLKKYTIT